MALKLPYKVKDLKSTQKNFDFLSRNLYLGRAGYCRVADLVSGGGAGNALSKGWTFTSEIMDSAFYELGTPPGTPNGVACAANSGVKLKQDGMYKIYAPTLCQGLGGVGGRYDAYLAILTSVGAVRKWADQCLINVPAGAAHVKHPMMGEVYCTAGEWVWPVNITAPTYGDAGAAWTHMEIRYMGK